MTEHEMLELILQKITGLEDKVTGLENKVTGLEDRMTGFEYRMTGFEDRMTGLETDVQKVERNLEELQQYYRISILENDNSSLLLKMYNNMQKEIEELKAKIA